MQIIPTTVDFATGMPLLPKEDMFWRVSEKGALSDLRMISMFDGPPQAVVQLVEVVTTKVVRKKTFDILWWSFNYGEWAAVETREVVRVSENVYSYEVVAKDFYDEDDNLIGKKEVREGSRVTGDDLTPELIYEHAEKALERYYEMTKSRGYLGDYPPKKLERAGYNGMV